MERHEIAWPQRVENGQQITTCLFRLFFFELAIFRSAKGRRREQIFDGLGSAGLFQLRSSIGLRCVKIPDVAEAVVSGDHLLHALVEYTCHILCPTSEEVLVSTKRKENRQAERRERGKM